MLTIQTNELINRVRRFLGVTGDSAIGLTETASPVLFVADVSGNPYRTDGLRFTTWNSTAALAGNFSGVRCNALALANQVAVIDTILINNATGAGVLYNVLIDSGGPPLTEVNAPLPSLVPESPLVSQAGGPVTARSPIVARQMQGAAFAGSGFDTVFSALVAAGTQQFTGLDLQVRSDQMLSVTSNAVNTQVIACFIGRIFQIRA